MNHLAPQMEKTIYSHHNIHVRWFDHQLPLIQDELLAGSAHKFSWYSDIPISIFFWCEMSISVGELIRSLRSDPFFFLGFTTIFLLRSPIFDACPTLSQLVPGEMSKFADVTPLPKLGTSGEAPSNCQLPAPVTRKKSGCVQPIDWGLSHSSLKSTLCVGGNKGKVYHFQMSEFFEFAKSWGGRSSS